MAKDYQKEELTIPQRIFGWMVFILIIGVAIFIFLKINSAVMGWIFSSSEEPSYTREEIKEKFKEELYDKYGEEFVVDRIGLRMSTGDKFYQARIYPESIIGTNKQYDDYYYGKASMDIKDGKLSGVADTYREIQRNFEIEDKLKPKAKELFGERVLFKVRQRYEKKNSNDTFVSYLNPSLEEVLERIEEDPDKHRLMLDLDLYIFNRIENDEEKEQRREDIFEFVQYLKEEGLYDYLEMRVVFVDERVLADSYVEYEMKVRRAEKVVVEIEEDDTTMELPPKDLRQEISEVLQDELEEMSGEELISNMEGIRKEDLSYEGIGKWNSQYQSLVYSEGILKERYGHGSDYEGIKDYIEINDVEIYADLEYVYMN
ncbi:MAG: hypothetical protein ACOCZR_04780 [Halanaerobiales bacterium]